MTAKFQPGDTVQWSHTSIGRDRIYVVKFCGEVHVLLTAPEGAEIVGLAEDYELALPEPYIGYTHGGSRPEGVPTVYPLSLFHDSDTFYDSELYEVEVRYIRKVDTRMPA